jgi:large subunit ribosomal protein L31
VKEGIHPKYQVVEVRCACGNTFKTRSTKPELHLEICSACHPFFTGRQKLIDTEGRVERFTKKFGAQTSMPPPRLRSRPRRRPLLRSSAAAPSPRDEVSAARSRSRTHAHPRFRRHSARTVQRRAGDSLGAAPGTATT